MLVGVGSCAAIIVVEYYIYLYILLVFRLAFYPLFFPSRNNILSKMPYLVMEIDTRPEGVFVVPPSGGFVGGPKKLTKIILFEPAGQKMHILPMNFNNS